MLIFVRRRKSKCQISKDERRMCFVVVKKNFRGIDLHTIEKQSKVTEVVFLSP